MVDQGRETRQQLLAEEDAERDADESAEEGPIYGHAGWVPGYVSFVRYLAKPRIAVAFQTNTDVGLLDGEGSAIADIEASLTRVVTDGR